MAWSDKICVMLVNRVKTVLTSIIIGDIWQNALWPSNYTDDVILYNNDPVNYLLVLIFSSHSY
jgi:hypothetical protein